MLQVIHEPPVTEWPALLQRPVYDAGTLLASVSKVLEDVRENGDAALYRLTEQFDKVALQHFAVSEQETAAAIEQVDAALKEALQLAKDNLQRFHQQQLHNEPGVETLPGVRCWRKMVPIEKVGLYIPGGTAPLFSTILMLGVPAKLAGCSDIILCTPPGKDGKVHPAILYTARLAGITRIFKVGGAQAIAAMAYGTETIPQVYKIFGPGNQYVTAAKQLVQQQGVAIDMPAGPSEVCVLADATAHPAFVAADLLSQAEHGNDSQVLLVSTSQQLVAAVQHELQQQLLQLPRKELATAALKNSKAITLEKMEDALALVNAYAAEHLIISCAHAEALAANIRNAGSVFIGNYSPESAGDYASGTNHTLPTNGYARAYSGVSVDSFVKKITYQQLTETGIAALGNAVITMARAEGLEAHARAVEIRLQHITAKNA
ncbi:MAG: histidinol dehydrogenase [Lacibacter sp.]